MPPSREELLGYTATRECASGMVAPLADADELDYDSVIYADVHIMYNQETPGIKSKTHIATHWKEEPLRLLHRKPATDHTAPNTLHTWSVNDKSGPFKQLQGKKIICVSTVQGFTAVVYKPTYALATLEVFFLSNSVFRQTLPIDKQEDLPQLFRIEARKINLYLLILLFFKDGRTFLHRFKFFDKTEDNVLC